MPDPETPRLEHRVNRALEIREEETGAGRQWWIRALPYDTLDHYGTTFRQGTFTESLRDQPPVFLYGHNYTSMDNVLGRVTDYRDTATALEVLVELDDPDAVPRARQAAAQLRSGTLRHFSVGFERLDDEPDPDQRNATRITKGRLLEISAVLDPAVPGTRVLAGRAVGDGRVTLALVREIAQHARDLGLSKEEARALLNEGVVPDPTDADPTDTAADDPAPLSSPLSNGVVHPPDSDQPEQPAAETTPDVSAALADADAALGLTRSR